MGSTYPKMICNELMIETTAENVAIFTRTMRGKQQLLYLGQPFVFEKLVVIKNSTPKKIWRCNQWWNQKCRARVFTIGSEITPLNRFHTHSEIVKRKQREARKKSTVISSAFGNQSSTPIKKSTTEYVVKIDV